MNTSRQDLATEVRLAQSAASEAEQLHNELSCLLGRGHSPDWLRVAVGHAHRDMQDRRQRLDAAIDALIDAEAQA